jgi:hypothetical protein
MVKAWRDGLATAIQAALPEESKAREFKGERLFPAYSVYNGWPATDERFELAFEPFPKCANRQLYPVKPRARGTGPLLAFLKARPRDYRRCRGKPTIKLGGKWLCARCSKEAPLPLWEGSELLHMRSRNYTTGFESIRFQMRAEPKGETLSQGQAQDLLGLDHDGLWKAMVGWPHIPVCEGAERTPYRFCPVVLALAREVLAQDAANRLLGEHSWREFRDRPRHFSHAANQGAF